LQHPVLESRDEPLLAHIIGDSDLSTACETLPSLLVDP
jgi:hypothetical protein